MKVKVIKANLDSYWYADNIGKVYDVEEVQLSNHSNLEYKVIGSELGGTKYFDKDDVEIINEESVMKRSDLRTGMRVIHGNHPRHSDTVFIVINDLGKVFGSNDTGFNYIASYTQSLEMSGGIWDVTEVYDCPKANILDFNIKGDLLWKRNTQTPEQKQLQEVMDKISDLQKQAEILQGMVGKSSK